MIGIRVRPFQHVIASVGATQVHFRKKIATRRLRYDRLLLIAFAFTGRLRYVYRPRV